MGEGGRIEEERGGWGGRGERRVRGEKGPG